MKQKAIFLLTISLFIITATFAQNDRGFKVLVNIKGTTTPLYDKSYALVIGNSNYTFWNRLPGVKNDVQKVKTALEENGFVVILKENLTKQQMTAEIEDFFTKYGYDANNRILIYYAGHGHTLNNGGTDVGYLVGIDAPNPNSNKRDFIFKSLPMAQFKLWSESSVYSKHSLFVFDACFAGSIFGRGGNEGTYIDDITTKKVRQFITSGSADETVPDKSEFCQAFVDAITTDVADKFKDGYVTGTELGEYLRMTVITNVDNQHPQYGKLRNGDFNKGDFVFVLNKQSNINNNNTAVNTTVEEEDIAPPITYGNLQITNYLQGKLYIDGTYKQTANKNKRISINDLPTGRHTIKIVADNETWQEQVSINQNQTATLTAKSTYVPPVADNTAGTAGTTYTNNKAGCTMIWAGGGTYKMGSNGSDAWDDEKPVHTVTVGNFSLSRTEITNSQYCKFLNDKGNQTEGGATWLDINDDDCQIEKSGGTFYPKSGKGNYPVIEVTWYGAKAYCSWAGGRLPTEAEWQFAAKAQSSYKYAGSNNIDEVAWYSDNSGSKTHPVAQKKANAFGLYDMSGNVWEWTEDKWHSNYEGAPTDGSAWTSGSSSNRVLCGGSWHFTARNSRSSVRNYDTPVDSDFNLGFRLCR